MSQGDPATSERIAKILTSAMSMSVVGLGSLLATPSPSLYQRRPIDLIRAGKLDELERFVEQLIAEGAP